MLGLFGKIKAAIVRREVKAALEPFDTEEERKVMAEEAKKNGMPPWAANLLSGVVGLVVGGIFDVANGGNLSDLLKDPKSLGHALLVAIVFRLAHSLERPKGDPPKGSVAPALAGFLALMIGGTVYAQSSYRTTALFANYDLDSASDISCVLGTERLVNTRITTAGSSTTVSALTAGTGPFNSVAVGDVIYVNSNTNVREGRLVTARASGDSITVDSAINIATTGQTFRTKSLACGTTANDGWFGTDDNDISNITIQLDQMNVATGAVGLKIECRYGDLGGIRLGVNVWPGENSGSAQCNGGTFSGGYCTYTSAASGSRISWSSAGLTYPNACRVIMKLTGTDDGSDVAAAAEKISAFYSGASHGR